MTFFEQLKTTFFIRLFAFLKIPLLGWVKPWVVEVSRKRTVLKIPLIRRTKNHLNVMYFGALAMGAEAAVAVTAVDEIRKSGKRVDFLFKDFQADFKKRAEGDVLFICDQNEDVKALIMKAIQTGEREAQTFRSYSVVPSVDPNEVIAEYKITMSVKYRPSKKS